MQRTWTNTGEPYTSGDDRARVEAAIEGLTWEPFTGIKPLMPALAIKAAIEELRLPKVSQVAIGTSDLIYPDGDSGGNAYYALFGIEANYRNGRARVFVLDRGSDLAVLASDFEPAAEAVTA